MWFFFRRETVSFHGYLADCSERADLGSEERALLRIALEIRIQPTYAVAALLTDAVSCTEDTYSTFKFANTRDPGKTFSNISI
jgi:hypothetical protein